MLHKDSSVPVATLLPEGQIGVMGTPMPGPPPPTDNPWLAAAAGVPVMPVNPPGPFGPGPVMPPVSVPGGDMVNYSLCYPHNYFDSLRITSINFKFSAILSSFLDIVSTINIFFF